MRWHQHQPSSQEVTPRISVAAGIRQARQTRTVNRNDIVYDRISISWDESHGRPVLVVWHKRRSLGWLPIRSLVRGFVTARLGCINKFVSPERAPGACVRR